MKNPWIPYIGRSYNTIRASLVGALNNKLPELVDRSPSNLFVILLDVFASVAEVLNYYIDNTVRELYPLTARRFSSMLKLAHFVNYTGKGRIPSSADIKFTLSEVIPNSNLVIPSLTVLSDDNGNTWLTQRASHIPQGSTTVMVPALQMGKVNTPNFKTADGAAFQRYELPEGYAHNSLEVTVEEETWARREVLGFSGPDDKHFTIELYPDNKLYLIFGDGVNGKVPENNLNIGISYYTTLGSQGNVPQDAINTLVSSFTLPGGRTLEVTNPLPSYGGADKENLARLRTAIPLSLRTLNRAVTRRDYEDIASLAPGVRVAKLDYDECGEDVNIYIVPNEGGIPSSGLLETVKQYVENRGIFTVKVNPRPSGESYVRISLQIKGEYGISSSTILSEATQALSKLYNAQTGDINQPVLLSHIISSVHNLRTVNNVILKTLYIKPYLRSRYHDSHIEYDIQVLPGANVKVSYILQYDAPKLRLLRGNQIVIEIGPDQFGEYIDIDNQFKILVTDLVIGAELNNYWEFTIYPPNTNIELDDFSVPVFDRDESILTIEEHSYDE